MKIDLKTLCELTKPLTLLYVEDDLDLRTETKTFLHHFFTDITVADDGQDGFNTYMDKNFDLIISDINMPKMNGIEMAKAIKNIKKDQTFIFISAHDDSEHLMKLMHMGITKFIPKPFKSDQLLDVLYETAKEIVEKKEAEDYYHALEDENEQLMQGEVHHEPAPKPKEKKVEAFELKVEQASLASSILKKKEQQTSLEEESIEIDIGELEDIFDQIDSIISMKCLSPEQNFTDQEKSSLSKLFSRYAAQLSSYQIFQIISQKLLELTHTIKETQTPEDISTQQYVFTLLESLLRTIKTWQESLSSSHDLNFYDDSISSDIDTIIHAWEDKHDDIEGEIEFF